MLALRLGWDQQTVDSQDADYIDELMLALTAEANVIKKRNKRQQYG